VILFLGRPNAEDIRNPVFQMDAPDQGRLLACSNSAIRSTSDKGEASPRATDPCKPKCTILAAFSSGAYSLNFAIKVDLSIANSVYIIPHAQG